MSENDRLSRRSAIRTGLGILAAGIAAAPARAQGDEDAIKLSKSRVHYQYTWNALGSHCGICANFIAPASCHIVEGGISPNGYCRVFSPQDIDLTK